MGWPEVAENGRKSGKPPVTRGGRRRRIADPILARLATVGRENLPEATSGCPLPHCSARVASGWPEVPPSVQSSTTRRWLNDSTWFPIWRAFSWGFGSSRVVLGARVSFGITSYVYIGSRVAFG